MDANLIDFLYNNRGTKIYNASGLNGIICGYDEDSFDYMIVYTDMIEGWSPNLLENNDIIFEDIDQSKLKRILYINMHDAYTDVEMKNSFFNLYVKHGS